QELFMTKRNSCHMHSGAINISSGDSGISAFSKTRIKTFYLSGSMERFAAVPVFSSMYCALDLFRRLMTVGDKNCEYGNTVNSSIKGKE
ncbi:hypothetical protein NDU88_001596, partial [Pleurodeles waltl]